MKKILVIEDDENIRNNIIELLENQNFQAIAASNGLTGVRLAQECLPDLIISDIMMTDLDGYGVLTALRQHPATLTIPFIFLTALADRADSRKGMELGADDYIVKPFTADELYRAISIRLEKQTAIAGVYTTALKQASQKLNQFLHYDPGTNLPNRQLLQERFRRVVSQQPAIASQANPRLDTHQTQKFIPIFYLSLDRFNRIIEVLGYNQADSIIQAVAQKLQLDIESSTIARLSTDELAILLAEPIDKKEVNRVAQLILQVLAKPLFLEEDSEVLIAASIGIVLFPRDGNQLEPLLQSAKQAATYAKHKGGNTFEFYKKNLKTSNSNQLALESDLSYAIERQELEVYYQPFVNLSTGSIVGAEALLRWQHSERGPIPPNIFIPIAEETNLIVPIGEWVLRTACQQTQNWRRAGFSEFRIAVNLSGRQFNQLHLRSQLFQILMETGLEPEYLELELTESTLVQEPEVSAVRLAAFKALGIKVAIDDFGTGYSSLSYLQQFPFDTLKIDQRFVRSLTNDTKTQAIVKAILQIGFKMNLKVVAEGVENNAELNFLARQNCHEIQGYLFSRPVNAKAFSGLLEAGKVLQLS